jgi:murein DD-endopeptidase MepM/ murein hydrolase activator NlpD
MEENYELSKEIVDFLYNGCVAFFPNQFYPEDKKVAPAVFYSGQNKETFEQKLLEVTQAKNIQDAIQIVKGWKIAVDRGEKVVSTMPTNIEELVASYEERQKKQETLKSVEEARESIAKAQEKKQATTNGESQQKMAKKQVEVEIEDTKVNTPELNLYSPQPQTAITLTKEQQQIVKLAHQDPQKFADQLKERIIETSKLNPENPLEIESADFVAKTFTLKLLNIDPKDPKITIDSSPFETLAFFANPENKELAKIIPDPEAREEIARASLEALYSLEKDSTTAANLVNQAFGQDWSPLFIPPQIRKLEVAPEGKTQEGGINVNLKEFLQQVANFQTLEKQIKNAILDEKTYNQLSKPEKARLETEIKKAAGKVSSATRAFSFITGKKLPPPQGQAAIVTTDWLDTQLAAIGISTQGRSLPITISLNFGDFSSPNILPPPIPGLPEEARKSFSSPNILSSPMLNFAFDKFIKKFPAVDKLNTVISGMTTKLGSKVATKIAAKAAATKLGAALAANVIPVIGQAVSIITALLSLKDIATLLKVWLKKNQDKLPFVLAGILVGAFALTGVPFYLIAGVGVIGVSRVVSIGAFLGGLFFTLTNIVLASLVIPMLIVFIGIPILVTIILFIINSGAYVYPPSIKMASLGPGVVVNEYIEVTKLAYSEKYPEKGKSSELSFENNQLPLEITYEITIKAKKGSLTNISISETCNVTKEKNAPSCPNPDPAIPNGSNIGTIDPASPYTFTYKKTFTSPQFEDTLTIDTITVSATNAEGEKVSSAGSASIKIGNPPEGCPNNAWPIQNNGGLNLVTQGPLAPFCSHRFLKQAIDIGVGDGTVVVATHTGTVIVGHDSCIGKYVKIQSQCGSVPFYSLYAHLGATSVSTGQIVTAGQVIGITDNTGTCTTGSHLHFEFRSDSNIPAVQKPYLIRNIPIGCCSIETCNP